MRSLIMSISRLSRQRRPTGRQHLFRSKKNRISVITTDHSLLPASRSRTTIVCPHELTTLRSCTGLPRSVPVTQGDRSPLTPTVPHSRCPNCEKTYLTALLLAETWQPLWLLHYYDAYRGGLMLTIPLSLAPSPPAAGSLRLNLTVRSYG